MNCRLLLLDLKSQLYFWPDKLHQIHRSTDHLITSPPVWKPLTASRYFAFPNNSQIKLGSKKKTCLKLLSFGTDSSDVICSRPCSPGRHRSPTFTSVVNFIYKSPNSIDVTICTTHTHITPPVRRASSQTVSTVFKKGTLKCVTSPKKL